MSKTRKRAAEMRSRWNKTGYKCNLSLDELEPLFEVYFANPKGKVVVLDKTKPITLDNIQSLSYDEYQSYKIKQIGMNQAKAHLIYLKKFNQPIHVTVNDLYSLLDCCSKERQVFQLIEKNKPVTIDNLQLLVGQRSKYVMKLRNNADQKIRYWKKKGLIPLFNAHQLADKLDAIGYETLDTLKGIKHGKRINIIDTASPLAIDNIEVFISVDDRVAVRLDCAHC